MVARVFVLLALGAAGCTSRGSPPSPIHPRDAGPRRPGESDLDGSIPVLVPIDAGPGVAAPLPAALDGGFVGLIPIGDGPAVVPTDVPEPTSTVESPRVLRWVLRGGEFRARRVEIVPTLSGLPGDFRLGGMSMDFFEVHACRECADRSPPLGMPPHSQMRFADRSPLAQLGGGPVWAIGFGTCPSGARCTRPVAVPAGTYTAELRGTFSCPAVTIQLPLARDVTVPCRAPAAVREPVRTGRVDSVDVF